MNSGRDNYEAKSDNYDFGGRKERDIYTPQASDKKWRSVRFE